MALIKCPECGKEVSDTAKACPNCGYDIQEYLRKENIHKIDNQPMDKSVIIKIVAIMAIFIGILVFYAFYQDSRCAAHGCNESSIKNSKYCEKHTCTNEGCYNYKEAWSTVCDTCHEKVLEELKNDNSIEEMENELREKYGDDIFSDEMHMPTCSMSGCDEEGAGVYSGKWYCSKHLSEMKGYGNIIAN